VERHDLTPGGEVTYFLTGPDGQRQRGWWRVASVNQPKSLEFTDGFADQNGTPVADLPTTRVQVQLSEHEGGTRMELRSFFDNREQMERLIGMGVVESFQQSVGQMDAVLANPAERDERKDTR
jgi:uncharacterized protein YndB with AHSA1/START domain